MTHLAVGPEQRVRTLVQVGNTPASNILARYAQQSGFTVTKLVPDGMAAGEAFGMSPAWDRDKQLLTFSGDITEAVDVACAGAEVLVWDDCYGSLGWLPADTSLPPFVVELRASNRQPGRWSEATLLAEAGFAYLTGHADGPPLALPGGQAALLTGAHGWTALAALLHVRGRGAPSAEARHVVLAALEVLATYHQFALVDYEYNGRIRPRSGTRWSNNHPICTYPCKDGYVDVCATTDDQVARLLILAGAPEYITDPRFATSTLRRENADAFDAIVLPALLKMTRAEITSLAGDHDVPIAPVFDPDETLAFPLSTRRGLWRTVGNKRLPELPRKARGPAPSAMAPTTRIQHASPAQPLAGIHVVEFSKVWAGPLLGRILADLGAEVVRIEPPFGRGPRHVPPGAAVQPAIFPGDDPGKRPWNRHGISNILNRNKLCMTLDIKNPRGREIAEQLCSAADIVFENNLPGALERAGLGYDTLTGRNPGLIYASLSGYGQGNEMSHHPAYGPVTEGAAGLTWWIRDERFPDEPLPTAIGYPDVAIATLAAGSILAGLLHREETGAGGYFDFSQIDTTAFMLTELLYVWQEAPQHDRTPALARHKAHALQWPGNNSWSYINNADLTAASRHLAILTGHPLSVCVECPGGQSDEVRMVLHAAITLGGFEAVMASLRREGLDCAIARDASEVYSSPELAEFWNWIDNPDIGRYRYDNSPFVIDNERNTPHSLPGMGEHNRTVLRRWLDLEDSELDALEDLGAIMSEPPGPTPK